MDYIGIDLHKNSSQVCILTEEGELIERRVKTDRESFDKLFAERPPARILVEASTESEWAARRHNCRRPGPRRRLCHRRRGARGTAVPPPRTSPRGDASDGRGCIA
jgi:hypothetical protein